jgi:predicted ATPase
MIYTAGAFDENRPFHRPEDWAKGVEWFDRELNHHQYAAGHVLTQEVAYESLLKQRRQEIHGRIARAIEELYADRLPEHYELLAHHYERSGNGKKAFQYLILAGEKSWENRAAQAAYEFFAKALKVAEGAGLSLDPKTTKR